MTCELTWHTADKVLLLSIVGDYTINDVVEVNRRITEQLDNSSTPLSIVIDATKMDRPFNFSRIRDVQSYMNHSNLENIFVAAEDRVVRLAMLVIFSLTRAHFEVFDSLERTTKALERQLSWPR